MLALHVYTCASPLQFAMVLKLKFLVDPIKAVKTIMQSIIDLSYKKDAKLDGSQNVNETSCTEKLP